MKVTYIVPGKNFNSLKQVENYAKRHGYQIAELSGPVFYDDGKVCFVHVNLIKV